MKKGGRRTIEKKNWNISRGAMCEVHQHHHHHASMDPYLCRCWNYSNSRDSYLGAKTAMNEEQVAAIEGMVCVLCQ